MKSLSIVPLLLAVSTASALMAPPAHSQSPQPQAPQPQAPQPQAPIVGNFRPVSVKDPEVVMAAKFAVGARAKTSHQKIALLSIQSAEKQLVAGMNYRVALKVKTGAKTQRVKATVYRDLQGKSSLSEWMPIK